MKVSIIPWIVKKLKLGLALVEDGDTASQNIASGKYVSWKGNMCQASSAISSGDTLSSSNLTAVDGGALNALNGNCAKKSDHITVIQTQVTFTAVTIAPGSIQQLVSALNLRTATHSALDTVPGTGTIVGAVMLWATGGYFIATDTLVDNQLVYVRGLNTSSSNQSLSGMRFLLFIKGV